MPIVVQLNSNQACFFCPAYRHCNLIFSQRLIVDCVNQSYCWLTLYKNELIEHVGVINLRKYTISPAVSKLSTLHNALHVIDTNCITVELYSVKISRSF